MATRKKRIRTISPEAAAFAARVRDARLAARIPSMSELARLAHADAAAGYQWERGFVSVPKGDTLLWLAHAMKVRPEWLLWGEEPRQSAGSAFESLHIPVIAQENADLERSIPGLHSRDVFAHFNVSDPKSCVWVVVSDPLLAPAFNSGDRLLVDRTKTNLQLGWTVLLLQSQVTVRLVTKLGARTVQLVDGAGEASTVHAHEAVVYGSVVGRLSVF